MVERELVAHNCHAAAHPLAHFRSSLARFHLRAHLPCARSHCAHLARAHLARAHLARTHLARTLARTHLARTLARTRTHLARTLARAYLARAHLAHVRAHLALAAAL